MTNENLTDFHMPEEWCRQVVEATKEGIWIVDSMFTTTYVNSSICLMLGYEPSEMIGESVMHFVFDKDDPSQLDEMQKRSAGISGIYLRLFRRKDGIECWCSVTDTPIFDDERKFAGSFSTLTDFTREIARENALTRELRKYETLLRNAPDGIHILDPSGNLIEANESFCKMLGYAPEEVQGVGALQWNIHFPHPALREKIPESMAAGSIFETRHKRKDGQAIDVEVSSVGIDIDGQPMLLCVSRDISARKQCEEKMKLATLIYESSAEAVMVTDRENVITDVNAAFTKLTGYSRKETVGKTPCMFQSSHNGRELFEEMSEALLARGNWQGEIRDYRKDGSQQTLLCNIGVLKDGDGNVFRHVAQFRDITQRVKREGLIWKQANYDVLTDLPNRRLFLDRLKQQMRIADRAGMPLALLFIDLDHFKEINDTLGHAKGDILLKEAAQRIIRCIRESDTVARIGGDEFTVIVQKFSDRGKIKKIAHAILHSLSHRFTMGENIEGFISASIGIAIYPADADNTEDLMKHADQAMYAAKQHGRNRLSFYHTSMQTKVREKMLLGNELRQALSRGELEVYYQPIIGIPDDGTVKAEALLRWAHPSRGMVSPDIFIPLAEESGFIVEIGNWVMREVISSIQQWRKKFGAVIHVGVNISPTQFDREEGFDWVGDLIDSSLPPGSINIEISEGLLIRNADIVKNRLCMCHAAGVEISIDDFGTGLSALSCLNEFPIDFIKIDRSFVNRIDSDGTRELVEAIIVMAGKLGMKIVTEGVETKDQLDLMQAFGSDYIQGFYFSPPVTRNEFERKLDMPGQGSR